MDRERDAYDWGEPHAMKAMKETDYPLWRLTQAERAKHYYDQWISDRDNQQRLQELRDARDARETYQHILWDHEGAA